VEARAEVVASPRRWTSLAGICAAAALVWFAASDLAVALPTLALIPPQFPRSEQPRALGVWTAVAWGGQAVGPAFGGLLTQTIGWRWIFWVNLPIAAVTLLVVRAATAESRDETAPPGIDLAGMATTATAAFALLSALTAGQTRGFGDPLVLTLFAAAVVLAGLFVLVERRVADPLVDLALCQRRPFDAALTANLALNLAFTGTTFLLALDLQDVRGDDPVVAGLLLPLTVTLLGFLPAGIGLERRTGARLPMLIGLAVMAVALALLGFLVPDWTYPLVAGTLLLFGIGLGLLSTPMSDAAVGQASGVPEPLAGMASGVFKMSSMLGSALGSPCSPPPPSCSRRTRPWTRRGPPASPTGRSPPCATRWSTPSWPSASCRACPPTCDSGSPTPPTRRSPAGPPPRSRPQRWPRWSPPGWSWRCGRDEPATQQAPARSQSASQANDHEGAKGHRRGYCHQRGASTTGLDSTLTAVTGQGTGHLLGAPASRIRTRIRSAEAMALPWSGATRPRVARSVARPG
jgi:MFS family permease